MLRCDHAYSAQLRPLHNANRSDPTSSSWTPIIIRYSTSAIVYRSPRLHCTVDVSLISPTHIDLRDAAAADDDDDVKLSRTVVSI